MDESRLDTMLRAAHMRLNASWMALVRTETDLARARYRHEIARMNRVLVARKAPGIAFRTAIDQTPAPRRSEGQTSSDRAEHDAFITSRMALDQFGALVGR